MTRKFTRGVQGVSSGLQGEILPFRDMEAIRKKCERADPLKVEKAALAGEQRFVANCISQCKNKPEMKGIRDELIQRDLELRNRLTELKLQIAEKRNARHKQIVQSHQTLPEIANRIREIREALFELTDLVELALSGEE